MTRYARQIAVPEFGDNGQAALSAAHVLIVGAGGLAAPVLPYLVGAGVGQITLVDPDVVSLSNLHRQTLFRVDDIDQPKVAAAARTLATLNPDCQITPIHAALDPANAAQLCRGATLVLDCADSFAASYILSDTCEGAGVPLISASVTGMQGYVGGFCGGAPGLRAVFPDLPQQMGSCATEGVLGPVVGIIGAMQAQMAISVLTGQGETLGRLTNFDAVDWRFSSFRFDGATPPAHAPRFVALSDLRPTDFIVDLRRADEGPLPHPAAIRAQRDELGSTLRPQSTQRAVLCCRSGLRAWHAAEHLASVWDGEITLLALGEST